MNIHIAQAKFVMYNRRRYNRSMDQQRFFTHSMNNDLTNDINHNLHAAATGGRMRDRDENGTIRYHNPRVRVVRPQQQAEVTAAAVPIDELSGCTALLAMFYDDFVKAKLHQNMEFMPSNATDDHVARSRLKVIELCRYAFLMLKNDFNDQIAVLMETRNDEGWLRRKAGAKQAFYNAMREMCHDNNGLSIAALHRRSLDEIERNGGTLGYNRRARGRPIRNINWGAHAR